MVVMFLWCVQEVAELKEEDLSSEEDMKEARTKVLLWIHAPQTPAKL